MKCLDGFKIVLHEESILGSNNGLIWVYASDAKIHIKCRQNMP